jgi:lipid A 3-O-deacylase
VRSAVAVAVLLLGVAASGQPMGQAAAQSAPSNFEIRAGVLAHDVPDLWAGFNLEGGVDINAEVLFGRGLPFLGGILRPALGASINTEGFTSRGYLDARWEYQWQSGLFVGLGLGAAVHNGDLDCCEPDRKALGSRVLFHIPLELGLRLDDRNSVSVYFEHTSNANLATPNEGLDAIGLRYGRRF